MMRRPAQAAFAGDRAALAGLFRRSVLRYAAGLIVFFFARNPSQTARFARRWSEGRLAFAARAAGMVNGPSLLRA